MKRSSSILLLMSACILAGCASSSQRIATAGLQTKPGMNIYLVIAADPVISADPGYFGSMYKFKTVLKNKIQQTVPGTDVIYGHPIAHVSKGFEMIVTVLDFQYVPRDQQITSGDARLRVHVQLTDVQTDKVIYKSTIGTLASDERVKSKQLILLDGVGQSFKSTDVSYSTLRISTGQVINKITSDMADLIGRQTALVHQQ